MTFQLKAQKTLKEIDVILKKNKIQLRPIIYFKNGKTPLLSRIALWIIAKQGGHTDFQLIDITKAK